MVSPDSAVKTVALFAQLYRTNSVHFMIALISLAAVAGSAAFGADKLGRYRLHVIIQVTEEFNRPAANKTCCTV